MKTTVTETQFVNAFIEAGRMTQFSRPVLRILFGLLENLEQWAGKEYELDVVGLCCEWVEATTDEIRVSYGPPEHIETDQEVLDWLNGETLMVDVSREVGRPAALFAVF